jgi:hypothetical protein
MYGTANQMISRFALQQLADRGQILIKPGVYIRNIQGDKILTRAEVDGYAYCRHNYILGEPTGFSGGFSIVAGQDTYDFNTGAITVNNAPADPKQGSNYNSLISPWVSEYYGKTAKLYCNEIGSPYLDVNVNILVNNFDGNNEGSYSKYSNGDIYDLSGILRLGNYVDFTVTGGASGWTGNGILFLEVKENGTSVYKASQYLTTGSSSANLTFRTQINYATTYEFKGYAKALTQYTLNYSNVTGYRACHL